MVGMAYVGIHVPRDLKEEQTWATDKWLQVISNIIGTSLSEPHHMRSI